ncbi:MAG: lysylphosphatidylglycerol synthase transmembrane domain-containing protein [Acidobacteriota bacterium]
MRRRLVWLLGLLGAVALLALLLRFSDFGELQRRIRELDPTWVLAASICAIVSYSCIGLCQRELLVLLGHELPRKTMVRIGLVSTVINRHVRSGGASGLASLTWLLRRHDVPAPVALSTMAAFGMLSNALFTLLLLVTAAVSSGRALGPEGAATASPRLVLVLVAASTSASLIFLCVTLVSRRFRRRWMSAATRVLAWLGERVGRPGWKERFEEYFEGLDQALQRLLARPRATLPAWGWAALRITSSVACLACCLRAIGQPLPVSGAVLTHAVAKFAGVSAFLPAGLGWVEGSMAGVLVLQDVPYEAGLLTALLHRAVYHLLPAAIALPAALSVLPRMRAAASAKGPESGEAPKDQPPS